MRDEKVLCGAKVPPALQAVLVDTSSSDRPIIVFGNDEKLDSGMCEPECCHQPK